MRLGMQHHVRQHRRCARTRDQEQVGESVDTQPEVGARAVRPIVAQRRTAAADDVDLGQRPGHRIETRCQNNRVEFVMRIGGVDPGGVNRFDRGGAHADQRHIGPVERLKVVAVGADSLGPDRDGRWESAGRRPPDRR